MMNGGGDVIVDDLWNEGPGVMLLGPWGSGATSPLPDPPGEDVHTLSVDSRRAQYPWMPPPARPFLIPDHIQTLDIHGPSQWVKPILSDWGGQYERLVLSLIPPNQDVIYLLRSMRGRIKSLTVRRSFLEPKDVQGKGSKQEVIAWDAYLESEHGPEELQLDLCTYTEWLIPKGNRIPDRLKKLDIRGGHTRTLALLLEEEIPERLETLILEPLFGLERPYRFSSALMAQPPDAIGRLRELRIKMLLPSDIWRYLTSVFEEPANRLTVLEVRDPLWGRQGDGPIRMLKAKYCYLRELYCYVRNEPIPKHIHRVIRGHTCIRKTDIQPSFFSQGLNLDVYIIILMLLYVGGGTAGMSACRRIPWNHFLPVVIQTLGWNWKLAGLFMT
jgi:hypothetical protein